MRKMSIESAKQTVVGVGAFYCEKRCTKENCDNCITDKAYRIIDKELEYRIAKPKHYYQGYRCVCGCEVARFQKFCDECGQKLLDGAERREN